MNGEKVGRAVKMLSWSGFIVLFAIDVAAGGVGIGVEQIAADLLYAVLALMLRPDNGRKPEVSLLLVILAFSVSLVASITGKQGSEGICLRTALQVIVAVILTQVDVAVRTCAKYRNVRSLFKSSQVLDNISDHARMQRLLALYAACALLMMASVVTPAAAAVLRLTSVSVLVLLFALESIPGPRFIFLGRHKFLQVSAMAKGKLKDNFVPEEVEGKDMGVTYKKAQECMEKSRPYLNPDLSLEDMARMVGTNKVYLSRTINVVSGRNFCQFVNYYRVQYAKEMMQRDSGCKMIEVAMASGFHSVVTFNMAFKVNEELTPSEWQREYRSS